MSKRDYYEILSVTREVSDSELKKSYRKLAMKYHPDRNSDDTEKAEKKFKELNEAYEVLKDPQKRSAYDQFGHNAFNQSGGGFGGFSGASNGFDFSDMFSSIFEEFSGDQGSVQGRRRRQSSMKAQGEDLRFDLEIALEDAFNGTKPEIKYSTYMGCTDCSNSGIGPEGKILECVACQGAGVVRQQKGFFLMEQPCVSCQGCGQTIQNSCSSCSGQGRLRKQRSISVNIPVGVDDGMRIRLNGEGEAGLRGGSSGDLYIFIHVLPHEIFQREDKNLFIKAKIPMITAILGGTVDVPTIENKPVELVIPAGTQYGKSFCIDRKGISSIKGGKRGDLIVEMHIDIPQNILHEQKEILEKFEELEISRKSLDEDQDNKPPKGKSGSSKKGKRKKKSSLFNRSKKVWGAARTGIDWMNALIFRMHPIFNRINE